MQKKLSRPIIFFQLFQMFGMKREFFKVGLGNCALVLVLNDFGSFNFSKILNAKLMDT